MDTESVKGLITVLFNTIRYASYFIEQDINVEYWKGQKDNAELTLKYLRVSALEFSVTEYVNSLEFVHTL